MPGQKRRADRCRDFLGEHGLARAGLALDQQRPLEHDRSVHRDLEVLGGDVILGTGKFHSAICLAVLERSGSEQETTA
jgi:hypothetical protein